MRRLAILLPLLLTFINGDAVANQPAPRPKVFLLHGLARTSRSMTKTARALDEAGFRTCNLSYPSTSHPVGDLAENFVLPQILACRGNDTAPLHFVTHSMGGIVVRYLAGAHPELPIGRVVMFSPPTGAAR